MGALQSLERVENMRDVLPLGVDGVAHHVHVVPATELEGAAGAALLREADQHLTGSRIDNLATQLRSGRARTVARQIALRARAGREIQNFTADDERLCGLR